MNLFSQRQGIKPIRTVIQVDSMDENLRIRLWNILFSFHWERVQRTEYTSYRILSDAKNIKIRILCLLIWDKYFGRPVDTLKDDWPQTSEEIKYYFFSCLWNEVYDFIEFVANNYPDNDINSNFMKLCNEVLEQELSAYRFAGQKITQITTEVEIKEIEEALSISIKPVREHLNRSLELLSDRKSPDYRNSIKEAISAVESLCKIISKKDKAELGDALKEIEDKVKLHPALKSAFTKLYGYTSDADGIRHGLTAEPNLDFEDAKFMLVSCSAFVNYLIAKSLKAGIKL